MLAICFFGLPVQAKYGGGTGELNNPYLIYTAEQINAIGVDVNDWDKHFKLMADIDLSGYHGTDFNIIGYWGDWADYKTFTGVFDGNGHTISNFSYTSSDTDCTGLFGRVRGENAEVRDLGLIDPNIDAGTADFVGSLVGHNWGGTITSCHVEGGSVWGDSRVGGLVGLSDGTIISCYATSTVSGNKSIGGLVGGNRGTITNCYATGGVLGNEDVGGLVGRNYERVTSSFWDIQTSGQSISTGGEGKTTAEMKTAGTFLEAGWDFVNETENGTEDIWWILEGQNYPRLVSKLSAFSLHPQNGAIDVFQPLILSWVPGASALHHDVYFGRDEEAVRNATRGSTEYKGSRDLGSESYDPGKLALNTTYYWRVDEVNNFHLDSPRVGNVWSFTTANFLVVDDFESYNGFNPEDPESNRIFDMWISGYGSHTNGSKVYDPHSWWWLKPDLVRVHGGSQSMLFTYYNHFMYSEATMTLVYWCDWTEEGVGVMSLWFSGSSANAAEPMYVAIANSGSPPVAVYHDDPNAAKIDTWTEWKIDLQEFADQGVDLTNINTISIGFGDKNNSQAGGSGMMFFDDIRLYPPPPEPAP